MKRPSAHIVILLFGIVGLTLPTPAGAEVRLDVGAGGGLTSLAAPLSTTRRPPALWGGGALASLGLEFDERFGVRLEGLVNAFGEGTPQILVEAENEAGETELVWQDEPPLTNPRIFEGALLATYLIDTGLLRPQLALGVGAQRTSYHAGTTAISDLDASLVVGVSVDWLMSERLALGLFGRAALLLTSNSEFTSETSIGLRLSVRFILVRTPRLGADAVQR